MTTAISTQSQVDAGLDMTSKTCITLGLIVGAKHEASAKQIVRHRTIDSMGDLPKNPTETRAVNACVIAAD